MPVPAGNCVMAGEQKVLHSVCPLGYADCSTVSDGEIHSISATIAGNHRTYETPGI